MPGGKRIFYQKQMTHHLLPEIERDWIGGLTNAFLIREPRAMICSLGKILKNPDADATGLPQQVEIFEWVRARTGKVPPVVDSRDILENPRGMLSALCEALGVEFTDAMLSWPPGRRATDGVWAPYWYDSVEKTTTFQPYTAKDEPVPAHLSNLLDVCQAHYDTLAAHRLRA